MRTGQPGLAGAPLNFGLVLAAHLVILTVVGVTTSKLDLQVSESKPILASIIAPSRPSPVVVPAPTPPKPVVKETPKKILTSPKPAPTPTPVAPTPEPVKKIEPSPVVEQKTDTKTKASQEAAASEVIQPKFDADYLNNPKPGYPSISRRLGEEGVVMLRVYVSAQGTPDQIQLLKSSGFARLDQAAQEAVGRWRFVPARQGKIATAAWVQVPVSFQLRR
ncbi:MAG: energy transducer TonB [Burkholderiaceae bacterium]